MGVFNELEWNVLEKERVTPDTLHRANVSLSLLVYGIERTLSQVPVLGESSATVIIYELYHLGAITYE